MVFFIGYFRENIQVLSYKKKFASNGVLCYSRSSYPGVLKFMNFENPNQIDELALHYKLHNRNFKYLPFVTLKALLKPLNFPSLKAYQEYIIENNLKESGWPIQPANTYKREYRGAEDFLSLPPGSINLARNLNRKKAIAASKGKPRPNRTKRNVLEEIHIEMNLTNICQFLIEQGMISTVQHILNENTLTLSQSKQISKCLIDHYDKVGLVSK